MLALLAISLVLLPYVNAQLAPAVPAAQALPLLLNAQPINTDCTGIDLNPNTPDGLCQTVFLDTLTTFYPANDVQVLAGGAVGTAVNCAALFQQGTASPITGTFSFELGGTTYTVANGQLNTAQGSDTGLGVPEPGVPFDPDYTIYTFSGSLDAECGTATIVWDSTCSPNTFFVSIILRGTTDNNGNFFVNAIASQSQMNADGSAAIVVAPIQFKATVGAVDFAGGDAASGLRRRALLHSQTAPDAKLAADMELWRMVREGDRDAHHFFHSNGGRHLAEESAVLMPSGRRLDDGSIITVLVLVTASAEKRVGGFEQVNARVQASIAYANMVLANSGVQTSLVASVARTAYVEKVPYFDEDNKRVSSTKQALDDLASEPSGVPDAEELRAQYNSDVVTLWHYQEDDLGKCGYSNTLPSLGEPEKIKSYSYSSLRITCTSKITTFAHELGHIFGLLHSRPDNYDDATQWMSYGTAYRVCGETIDGAYNTLMSDGYQDSTCKFAQCTLPVYSFVGEFRGRTAGEFNELTNIGHSNAMVAQYTYMAIANIAVDAAAV
ncbi:hypothetical protein JKP88DRAFT_328942 [Tribonema minus]|uniref:Uncharacterized protein n=1 Tax=Tribonema minus TaxID=303371 RepID=A0A835YQ03_9STRA|nr:hypothetical protein JKP88DRAFT_328942 [Tribonema minus]